MSIIEPAIQNWSTKLEIEIWHPSSKVSTKQTSGKLYSIENISITRNREQRGINTVGGARKGFVTVEGDFTATFAVNHMDPRLPKLEELYANNEMFDLKIVESSATPIIADQEWQFNSQSIRGCMFETATDTYQFGDKPMREFTIKFLGSSIVPSGGSNEITEDNGIYGVDVTW